MWRPCITLQCWEWFAGVGLFFEGEGEFGLVVLLVEEFGKLHHLMVKLRSTWR